MCDSEFWDSNVRDSRSLIKSGIQFEPGRSTLEGAKGLHIDITKIFSCRLSVAPMGLMPLLINNQYIHTWRRSCLLHFDGSESDDDIALDIESLIYAGIS